jgi:hypothetical protein
VSRFEFPCPSCGAKLSFESSISATAVCAYCRCLAMRDDQGIKDLGKVGQLLPDGSPIQLGTAGVYGGVKFAVLGRAQMSYDQGVWNEWFLGFDDGKQGWLGEAQGLYAISFSVAPKADLPRYDALHVGQTVAIGLNEYEVRDRRKAGYCSAEGQLPFKAPLGPEFPFVDLGGQDARFATIDYSETPPLLLEGRALDFPAFEFANLRKFEGW